MSAGSGPAASSRSGVRLFVLLSAFEEGGHNTAGGQ